MGRFELKVMLGAFMTVKCIAGTGWPSVPYGAEVVSEPAVSKVVDGRLKGERALLISSGAMIWEFSADGGRDGFEFWMKPDAWLPTGTQAVELCRFRFGPETFTLQKVVGSSVLTLSNGAAVSHVYPVNSWDEAAWASCMSRNRKREIMRRSMGWHHVQAGVDDGRLRLAIDGFLAREVREACAEGAVTWLSLTGNPGTAFLLPVAVGEYDWEPTALRQRFLALFLNKPSVRSNLLTIPHLFKLPVVDGRLGDGEWDQAARISGLVTLDEGLLTLAEHETYVGYASGTLYAAMRTRPEKQASKKSGMPLPFPVLEEFRILLGPPFVSGEEPRRLVQIAGGHDGSSSVTQVLPETGAARAAGVVWKISESNGECVAEASVKLSDIGFPEPGAAENWNANFMHLFTQAAWVPVVGGGFVVESLGELRFDNGGLAVRAGRTSIGSDGRAEASLTILAPGASRNFTAGMEVHGENGVLPLESAERLVAAGKGEKVEVRLSLPIAAATSRGRISVYVKDGSKNVFFQSGKFSRLNGDERK